MALVPAIIKVTFTADYAGCNRVCYRINGSGGYTCVDVNCVGGGASCDTGNLIQVSVDNETCPTVEFDGYVQACCEDISSLEGRVPFTTSFVPSPACKRYLATCESVSLFGTTITSGGSGYTVGTNPSVGFSGGGGGSGAAGTVNVGTGFITTSSVTSFISSGSGYTPGTYSGVHIDGGSGTGAIGTFIVSGAGAVISGQITSGGDGYLSSDVLHPRAADMGGNVSDATFNITSDYGTVISILLTNLGSGYTVAPNITIAPPPSGVTATATALLGYCSSSLTVNSCTNTGKPILDNSLQPGQSVDFCTAGTPPAAPVGYSITQDTGNCLCNCESVTIQATGTSGSVSYVATTCNRGIHSGTLDPRSSPSSITTCIVSGSLIISTKGQATGVVTYNGAC